mmetsp:Transcript_14174/g.40184  ORF Transcript_14174/g.40184 Transcript_14174/m.40184 type:complete len:115 (+) Transcript_14174:97-441(+)
MKQSVFLAALSVLLAASYSVVPGKAQDTVVDVVVGSPNHTVLASAVTTAGLVDALSADGPFTVLAPTDAAFADALAALDLTAGQLMADTDMLTSVLQYHVIPGKVGAERITPPS